MPATGVVPKSAAGDDDDLVILVAIIGAAAGAEENSALAARQKWHGDEHNQQTGPAVKRPRHHGSPPRKSFVVDQCGRAWSERIRVKTLPKSTVAAHCSRFPEAWQ